jgi:hypothetical protein
MSSQYAVRIFHDENRFTTDSEIAIYAGLFEIALVCDTDPAIAKDLALFDTKNIR